MSSKDIEDRVAQLVPKLLQVEAEQLAVSNKIAEVEINIVSTASSITRGELEAQERGKRDIDWRIRADYALAAYKTEKLRLQMAAKHLKSEHHAFTQELRSLRRRQTERSKLEEYHQAIIHRLKFTKLPAQDIEALELFGQEWIRENTKDVGFSTPELDGEDDG